MITERAGWGEAFSDSMITRIWKATPWMSEGISPLRIFTLEWMIASWERPVVCEIIKRGAVPKTFIKQALMLSLDSIQISTGLRCNQRLRAACAEFRQGAQKQWRATAEVPAATLEG